MGYINILHEYGCCFVDILWVEDNTNALYQRHPRDEGNDKSPTQLPNIMADHHQKAYNRCTKTRHEHQWRIVD